MMVWLRVLLLPVLLAMATGLAWESPSQARKPRLRAKPTAPLNANWAATPSSETEDCGCETDLPDSNAANAGVALLTRCAGLSPRPLGRRVSFDLIRENRGPPAYL